MPDDPAADSPVPDKADRLHVAREALARAKADALARGMHPAHANDLRPERKPPVDSAAQPGPRRARRDDPEPLGTAIHGLMDARGWQAAAAVGSVFGRWGDIVGPELAAHTRPDGLADGELTVTADSTAWATQVRLLAAQLARTLNAELGDRVVQRVKVRGPASAAGPARRRGEWRVRGSRGPRDTYG
jgi:predicted nucleic acid-binding Zn ribbon protein